jgi:hypothetical protein
MDQTHRDFAFVDGDRTFTCHVEAPRHTPAEAWWWFHVSTERYQRHAPFRAATADTPVDVRARVVAYYDHLLARRAEPSQPRWGRRQAPRADAATPPEQAVGCAV